MDVALSVVVLVFAAIPAAMFAINLLSFRRAPRYQFGERAAVSVLIPARNEEASIGAAIESVLTNHDVDVEVIVLDDHSDDDTARVVRCAAEQDARVRLIHGPTLPQGWCGKQHACHVLSQAATRDLLCFLDADVRLAPDALARMVAFHRESGAALVSGFPRQVTLSFAEQLLIPLIHYVLLGFLPVFRMRQSTDAAYAAGCGQLMLASRAEYAIAGGHAAIRGSLHDGLKLPKAFRAAGFRTDIFDATDTARCRMYRSAGEVWFGLAKNAVEGLAAPSRIVVFTLLLVAGSVVPFLLLAPPAASAAGIALAYVPRILAARRFDQPWASALLHPVGVLVLLAIQWYALARHLLGRPAGWKGRAYAPAVTGSASPR